MNTARLKKISLSCIFLVLSTGVYGTEPEPNYSFKTSVGEVRLIVVATDRNHRKRTELGVVDNEAIIREFQEFSTRY